MAFFSNDAVNRVNVHSAVFALAQAGGGVFFFAILLRAGVSVPAALAAQAAIQGLRFALRPGVLALGKRVGLKPLVVAGTMLIALQYPVLGVVDGVGSALFVLCGVAAIGEVLYWPAYNAYFAAIGDAEHRGHQVSAREAMVATASIAAPLAGAWAFMALGAGPMLGAVALVQLAAALPLIGAPRVTVAPTAPGSFMAARLAVALYAADGWTDAFYIFVWQIALFQTLGESVTAYGGAMALAGGVGAIAGLFLGRHVDSGHGARVAAIVFAAAASVMALRATSVGAPALAIGANALGPLVMTLMSPVLGVANYNLAKASPCPLRFQIIADGGWDIGCALACLCAAALAAAQVSPTLALLLAIPSLGAQALLLRGYYRRIALARRAPGW